MLGFDDARGSKFGCRAVGIDTYRRRGVADLLRSTSLYRGLGVHTREPLLEAIPDRLPTRMDDRAPRRYLSVLRARKRAS